jgi:hypothetical protein
MGRPPRRVTRAAHGTSDDARRPPADRVACAAALPGARRVVRALLKSRPGGSTMNTLRYELKLPNGANNNFVIVAGGADINRDGTISNADEVRSFTAQPNNHWTLDQPFQGNASGMIFAVMFTVGVNVKWELTIKDDSGTVLYTGKSTTIDPFDTISYHL